MSYQGIYDMGRSAATYTLATGSGVLRVNATQLASQEPPEWDHSTSPPQHTRPLYHSIPLPPVSQGTVSLHHVLEYLPTPTIIYNLLEHPNSVAPNYRRASFLSEKWKNESATSHGLTHLTIRVPNLDRPIVINQVYARSPVVTIESVLTAVYQELRNEAYLRLCSARPGYPHYVPPQQIEEDIQRVTTQILGGRVLWDGLSPSRHERDVWVLHVR